MKLELLVIVYQHDTVNSEPGLVHTARHAMEAGFVLRIWKILKIEIYFFLIYLKKFFIFLGMSEYRYKMGNWGEVVTR